MARIVLAGLIFACAFVAQASHAREPFEGLWGDNAKACRDPDGVNRMEINRSGIFWYETRCRPGTATPAGPNVWTMRLQCEGEGQRYRAQPRITLTAKNRLVMDASPVGPTKRQVYVRCKMS